MSKEAMKLALEAANKAMKAASKCIEELGAKNKALKEEFDILFAEHQKLLGELQAMRAVAQQEQGEPSIQSYFEKNNSQPVAWLEPEWGEKICPEVGYEATITDDHPRDLCWIPLFPNPQQRKPLTDEQIEQMWERTGDYDSFARAIEAAHGIGDKT